MRARSARRAVFAGASVMAKSDLVQVIEALEANHDFYRAEADRLKRKVNRLMVAVRKLKSKLREQRKGG